MSKRAIAAGLACILVASGCSSALQTSATADSVDELTKNLSDSLGSPLGLAALPSDSPDSGYEAGGGGLIGDPAPVWGLPGARSANDPGIAPSKLPVAPTISLRPRFTAAPGKDSYQFTVMDTAGKNTIWDSGTVTGSTSDCEISSQQASCTLPAQKVGVLTNGSTYRLVTSAGGVTTPRLFRVDVPQGATGATGSLILGRRYTSAVANMQMGMSFATANQGPVAGSHVTIGPNWGLPAGWQWQGPANGFVSITRSDNASSYSGFTQLLSIDSYGSDQTLGCKTTNGATQSVCGALSGDLPGIGYAAVIEADGSVVVTDQASGQNWTFNTANQLVASGAPGSAPVSYTYRTVGGAPVLDTMKVAAADWSWKIFYAGDAECQDKSLPSGFVATPTGFACGWTEPDRGISTMLYTQPSGATVPRLSRVIHAPAACATWQACDTSQLSIFDLGWDVHNRIQWQRQDALVDASILGSIDQNDQKHWAHLAYDSLGRMTKAVQPVTKSDGAGNSGQLGGATDTFSYESADSAYAPATTQVVKTSALEGSPTLVEVTAVDDAGRTQFRKSSDGYLTANVWDEDLPLQFATVGQDSITSRSYDDFNRVTATYSGSPKSFDTKACAPNAPDRVSKSCQPANGSADAALTGQTYVYDQVSATGNGLQAEWFDSPNFSGNPATITRENQVKGKGFSIAPPASVHGSWGVRLNGSVILNAARTWNITVNVPKTMFSGGALFIDNQVCALIVAGQTRVSCTFASDGSTYPIRLDLSRKGDAPSSGQVSVALQQDQFAPAITDNSHFLPLWGAKQSQTSLDHNPDGSPITQVTTYRYDSPITDLATTQNSAPTKSGPKQPAALERKTAYSPNGFGGAVLDWIAGTSGTKKTQEYWGLTQTPKSAGVPNLDQIPEALRNTVQQGLPRVRTSAAGQKDWTIYNVYGQPTCQASVRPGVTPAWSCEQRDGRGRLTATTFRGQDGQQPVELSYVYSFNPQPDSAPFVLQTARSESGTTIETVSREWPGGELDMYAGGDGSLTTYAYEPRGAVKSSTTHIANAVAYNLAGSPSASQPGGDTTVTYEYSYDDLGRASTVSNDGGKLAAINYSHDNPRQIESYDYFDGKVRQVLTYDEFQRAIGREWKLKDETITDKVATTAAGRKLNDQFGNVNDTYTYDGFGRLLQSATTVDQTRHDFTYGWDEDSQRVCAAANLANSDGKACDELAGATTFEYKNNLLVSSSAPASAIPADPLTKDGSFRQIGSQLYQYDATGKLATISDTESMKPAVPVAESASPEASATASESASTNEPAAPAATPSAPSAPTKVEYLRDAANRIILQTTHSPAGTSSVGYVYIKPTDSEPIATVTNTGAVTTVASLPGGLAATGDTMQVPASSGTATITVNSDGSRNGTTNVWGPYGEPVTTNQESAAAGWRGQSSVLNGTVIDLKARTYRPDLAVFLQTDPISGGSGTMNDHSYVAGDPINTTDLTGTDIDSIAKDISMVAIQVFFQALMARVVSTLVRALPEWFLAGDAVPARVVYFGLNLAVGTGCGLANDYLTNGELDFSEHALATSGTASIVGGLIGAITSPMRAAEEAVAQTIATQTEDADFVMVDEEVSSVVSSPEEMFDTFIGQTIDEVPNSEVVLDSPPRSPDSPSTFSDSAYSTSSEEQIWETISLDGDSSPASSGWQHPSFTWNQ